jgi:tmRNA-binding protein
MDNEEARENYENQPDEEHRKMLIKRKQIDQIVQKNKTLGEFLK